MKPYARYEPFVWCMNRSFWNHRETQPKGVQHATCLSLISPSIISPRLASPHLTSPTPPTPPTPLTPLSPLSPLTPLTSCTYPPTHPLIYLPTHSPTHPLTR